MFYSGPSFVGDIPSVQARSVFICWNFICLIITTLYVTILVAMTTVPPKALTIDTFSQLASLPEYKVMVYQDSSIKEAFKVRKY